MMYGDVYDFVHVMFSAFFFGGGGWGCIPPSVK